MTTTRHDFTADEARTIAEALRDYADSQDDPGQFIHVYDLADKIDRTRDADHRAAGRMSDPLALDHIAALMDGREWSADTLDEIARIARETGRTIRDTNDDEAWTDRYGRPRYDPTTSVAASDLR